MRVIFALLIVVAAFSCNNGKNDKVKNGFSDTSGYKKIMILDSNVSIDFSVPDDIIETSFSDSSFNKQNGNMLLLKAYLSESSRVKIFVSKMFKPDEYINSVIKKASSDSANPIHIDTIKMTEATNMRLFYTIPQKGIVNFKNFIYPIKNTGKDCYLIDYVLPSTLDSAYQGKIGFSLETISLRKSK